MLHTYFSIWDFDVDFCASYRFHVEFYKSTTFFPAGMISQCNFLFSI